MNLEKTGYRPVLLWLSLAVLVVLVCLLGVLQYRWIGEISEMEQRKLQDYLQSSLNAVSRDFNSELNTSTAALIPTNPEVNELGREPAYERRYARWREMNRGGKLFNRIALTWEENGELTLRMLDPESGAFAKADWPATWNGTKERITERLHRDLGGPGGGGRPGEPWANDNTALIALPRFSNSDRGGPPDSPGRPNEREWLILEVDSGYITKDILPELFARHFGANYAADYQVNVFERANPAIAIFKSGPEQHDRDVRKADASAALFDVGPPRPDRGRMRFGRPGPSRFDEGRGMEGGGPPSPGPGFPPWGNPARGRWNMTVHLNAGSLATVVGRVRQRNLAISAAILLLVLVTCGALVRFSRQAQRLAEIEMEFVAGVSHELRTPLTVVRTAAFNLRGKLASNPIQVERYGALILQESEKLTAIVEQVLRFAAAKTGYVIRERQPVSVEELIEDTLQSSKGVLEASCCEVETVIEPGLPLISGDVMALRHALQNLIINAVKYGIGGVAWIGIFARLAPGPDGSMIEIRVADRGPGIPREEQRRIFDAFFRGKKAVRDQIHGTGLGLNLVKKIVEAHGGTVQVQSEPDAGTSFIVRIPGSGMEKQVEFTHSIG
jgi:signal transduction histidine kinase